MAMSQSQETTARAQLKNAKTVVVKVGSSLLTDPRDGLARGVIERLGSEIATLLDEGIRVLLVSSGAVVEGIARLGWPRRPETMHELQAAAAVGQMGLIEAWEQAFAQASRHTALVLLTHDDLADRQRYLNARATLATLLGVGVVPVINENDSVATDEIRFGDNDTLAALVTNLVQAELLVVLTDIEGLLSVDPRRGGEEAAVGELISCAPASDGRLDAMVGDSGSLGRGGMITKLQAARLAARSGASTVLASGRMPEALRSILAGRPVGTLLTADLSPFDARKRWIAGQLKAAGELQVDAGAARALVSRGVSLLPVGVTAVSGQFSRGDLVRCVDADGQLLAQGLSNYSSEDTQRLLGVDSREIGNRLGFQHEPELIHRDNLVVLVEAG
jgi:glutamate 5-kinase